jgi:hypothetical protein
MALDITNPQTITTGEGSGFAKVIPLDKFQPADTSGLINEKWKQYELENQRKKKLDTNLSNLPKAVVAKQERNRAEIANDYNDLLGYSVSVAAKGIDLTSDPEFMRREQALKQKVAMDELTAKKIEDYKAALEKDGTKYDQDLFEKRLNEYLQAPNMEETVSMFNQPWLVENVDVFGGLKDMMPNVQGYGALTPAQVEETAKAYIMTKPEIVKAGIARGVFKDEADALEKYKAEVKRMGEYKTRPQGSGGGGLNFNFGGNNTAERKGMFVATHESSKGYEYNYPNETNVVKLVDDKGKQATPQQLTDKDGNTVFVQIEELRKSNKGGGWVIIGRQAKRYTTDQYKKAVQSGANVADFTYDEDSDSYVSIQQTEPIRLPISNDPQKAGYSNYSLISGIGGGDVFELVMDRDEKVIGTRDPFGRKQKEGQSTPQAKPKAATTSNEVTDLSSVFGQPTQNN